MPTLPKLSYVLLSHNRERYIRQAIESAFAQTYEGELEYIISDDCSTDHTYDIIQECVAAYKGERRIVVTRTPHNLHLAGNTNHALQFVEADWIVRADDDDFSSIDRCQIIGKAIQMHPGATFVATGVRHFNDSTETSAWEASHHPATDVYPYEEKSAQTTAGAAGMYDIRQFSMKCWRRDVYETFGPLEQQAYYVDDLTCFLRACLLGYGIYTKTAAVYIRQDCGNMSQGHPDGSKGYSAIIRQEQFTEKYQTITSEPLEIELQKFRDYLSSKEPAEQERSAALLSQIEAMIAERKLLMGYWKTSCRGRLRIRKQMGEKGVFSLIRCLPLPVFAGILSTYRKLFKR